MRAVWAPMPDEAPVMKWVSLPWYFRGVRSGIMTILGGVGLIALALLAGATLGLNGRADREAGALLGLVVAGVGIFRCLRASKRGPARSVAGALCLIGVGIAAYVVPSAQKESQRETQDDLLSAINRGDAVAAERALEQGANPDDTTSPTTTPLILASGTGALRIAELLLNAGANPNVSARNGMTPLIAAVSTDHMELVRLLVNAGANPRARSQYGSPLELAQDNPQIHALLSGE